MSLFPMVGGATAALAAWALGLDGAIAFAGVASLLGGTGVALTRLLVGDEGAARRVFEEMERETEKGRQAALDSLFSRLAKDNDPRDEQLLQDLRGLAATLREPAFWPRGMSARSSVDIAAGVESLFDCCVQALERQLSLSELAQGMLTPSARAPIAAERERILGEISASIAKLSEVVAQVQAARAQVGEGSDLTRIRQDLDDSLAVAARVADRMRAWDKERQGVLE